MYYLVTAALSAAAVLCYLAFRYASICIHKGARYGFLYGAFLVAIIGLILYAILVFYGQACHVAVYYVLTFLGLILVGKYIFDEDISSIQVFATILIVLGLLIWVFYPSDTPSIL